MMIYWHCCRCNLTLVILMNWFFPCEIQKEDGVWENQDAQKQQAALLIDTLKSKENMRREEAAENKSVRYSCFHVKTLRLQASELSAKTDILGGQRLGGSKLQLFSSFLAPSFPLFLLLSLPNLSSYLPMHKYTQFYINV